MRRTLTLCRTALAGAALAVLLTACGGGSNDNSASSTSAKSSTSSSSSAAAADTEFCKQAATLHQDLAGAHPRPRVRRPAVHRAARMHLEVQVRPGRLAAVAHLGDLLAGADPVAGLDEVAVHVAVDGHRAVVAEDVDRQPEAGRRPG